MRKRAKKKLNIEAVVREQAFQLYKKLGNLKKVAEVPGMPAYSTLLKWKEEDNWDKRIDQARENLEKWESILAKIESDGLVKDDVAHLMLLNFLFEKTVKAIIEKDLEPNTWKEALDTFKMIFEQKRILFGRATSKSEIDIDFTSMDEHEIRETLRKINELLHGVSSPHSPEEKVKALVQKKVELEKALEDKSQDDSNINDNATEIYDKEVDNVDNFIEENKDKLNSNNFLDFILEEEI